MKRIRGRPRKTNKRIIPWEEIDALLVFGEKLIDEETKHESVRYPSFRQLAERYGVSKTLIQKYSTKHNCIKRREENRLREQIQFDQKVVKQCSDARATATVNELQIIDGYIRGFQKALNEGRIDFCNPTDFNQMVRLKEFKMGNADSRQEIQGALSLEQIQSRHKQLRDQLIGLVPSITGMVEELDENIKTSKEQVETEEVYQDAIIPCAN